jgi:hypothetical protein
MKFRKIGLFFVIVFILFMPTFLIYTRVSVDKCKMSNNGDTLILKDSVYVRKNTLSAQDTENIGITIGIGIYGKGTITDYIFPNWIMEYKNDKKHNRIFVRGLMDMGSVYEKETK